MAKEVSKLIFGDHDPYANLDPILPFDGFAWEGEAFINFEEVIRELRPKLVVEIGTWIGASAMWMIQAALRLQHFDMEIVCIDTFLGSVEHLGEVSTFRRKNGRPIIYEQFLSNIIHQEYQNMVTPFPIDSHNGMLFLEKMNVQPDLIYVDGAHDYASVCHDLIASASILKNGGWILGDDFHHPDVKKAAFDTFGEDKVYDKGRKFIWVK
jgi:hypothetical protein